MGLKRGFIFLFHSVVAAVLHCKITVKNKADYFADFTYRGLLLERIPRDKRGFTE